MVDISVIITGHREGIIAGATVRSALAAIAHAQSLLPLEIEIIAVLDGPDEVTRSILESALADKGRFVTVHEGDPGQSRNRGVEQARGKYATFLDADDLWSFNWLAEAWRFSEATPGVIAHSTMNIVFGHERLIWWHVDSQSPLFDKDYLEISNYWDAMSFAPIEIYRTYPFKANNIPLGFAHEDWHWNAVTFAAGIPHRPVPDTVHFKRRRSGSQMAVVARTDALAWPLNLRQS
jgi:glycosyltransferase involved in cell wall biosynthesis